ncbi:hypothetical protein BGZ80_001126 [Entomortierella chlamydospora]|uniref:Polysaccharide lyase 14 domain-containing protein n=1 Tax=Entomortierella chlamydospora TaxID=101097 RepID=A0A9P6MS29_9FUNG|nr:hypothetical protein BGZ79_001230 [Entomortierella chlamydospora]KAG0010876.1 hypothetical protein BGZ80_001126 [Entomortierella chlamydospora]
MPFTPVLASNKIYSWEVKSFPKSISQLTKPLHLTYSLKPGKSPFDIVPDPKNKHNNVLRSIYPAHSYAHSGDPHAQFISDPLPIKAFTGSQNRYIRMEYQLMFQPGFKWVKGGKLPGILLGSERGCNAGCSGGGTAENCFSTRMMWRADGKAELYLYAARSVYFPKMSPETCKRSLDKRSPEALFQLQQKWLNADRIPDEAEEKAILNANGLGLNKREDGSCLNGMGVKISPGATNLCNPSYGISIGRGGSLKFKSGTWHNITQVVRINSKGKAVRDGYLAVYLDGKKVISANKLVFLKDGYNSKSKGDDSLVKFMFSSFFGGGTSDYATPKKQWIAWKGFKMATSAVNIWK